MIFLWKVTQICIKIWNIKVIKNDEYDCVNSNSEKLNSEELIKQENEKMLISLTKWTGGGVFAASNMQQIFAFSCIKRVPRSTRTKLDLLIAPDLCVTAYTSLLVSKANILSLKRETTILMDIFDINASTTHHERSINNNY